MFRRGDLVGVSLLSIFLSFSFAQAKDETLTITTYYPSPYGVYNELRAKKMAIGDTYFTTANQWKASCDPANPATCGANDISGNADLVVEGALGIGTKTPLTALDIVADAESSGFGGIVVRAKAGVTSPGIAFLRSTDSWTAYPADIGVAGAVDRFLAGTKSGDLSIRGALNGDVMVGTVEDPSDAGCKPRITVKNNGAVGIGTTDPFALLSVVGGYLDVKRTAQRDDGQPLKGVLISSVQSDEAAFDEEAIITLRDADGNGDDKSSIFIGPNTKGGENMKGRIQLDAKYIEMIVKDGVTIGNNWPTSGVDTDCKLYVYGDARLTGTAYNNMTFSTSDARWKKDINPLNDSLEKILALQGVTYAWRKDEFPDKNFADGKQVGLIAQEVEKIIPEVVHTDKTGYKSLSYEHLVPVLIEAIKEQQEEIQKLRFNYQHKIEALQTEVQSMKELLKAQK